MTLDELIDELCDLQAELGGGVDVSVFISSEEHTWSIEEATEHDGRVVLIGL